MGYEPVRLRRFVLERDVDSGETSGTGIDPAGDMPVGVVGTPKTWMQWHGSMPSPERKERSTDVHVWRTAPGLWWCSCGVGGPSSNDFEDSRLDDHLTAMRPNTRWGGSRV